MTQRYTKPRPLFVETDAAGHPIALRWRKKLVQVVSIANHWRVKTLWWRDQLWRDYFKVRTANDWLVLIFHDLLLGQWYVQQRY